VRNLPHFQHLLVAAWFTKKKTEKREKKNNLMAREKFQSACKSPMGRMCNFCDVNFLALNCQRFSCTFPKSQGTTINHQVAGSGAPF